MKPTDVTLYTTRSFRSRFLDLNADTEPLFKADFEQFFSIRIEDVYQHTHFPIPPSRESIHSVMLVTRGAFGMHIGTTYQAAGPGDVLVVPAGCVFAIPRVSDDIAGFTCHFAPDMLTQPYLQAPLPMLLPHSRNLYRLDEQLYDRVRHLMYTLHTEYTQHGIAHRPLVSHYLTTILLELQRLHRASVAHEPAAAKTIRKLQAYLADRDTLAQATLKRMADYLGITPNHLNKSVKAALGKPANQLLTELRLLYAKELLAHSDYPIKQIAIEVGFKEVSYFNRRFRQLEGCTPSAYRRTIWERSR